MSWCDPLVAKVQQKVTRKNPLFLAHCQVIERNRAASFQQPVSNELASKALADGKLAVGTPGGYTARIDGLSVPPFVSSDFALRCDFRLGSALSGAP